MDASFRIEPARPLEELFVEARSVRPPDEEGSFLPADFVRLGAFDARIRQDIRYATSDNFLGAACYAEAEALLQRSVAESLSRVQDDLERDGLGLILYDAYRPWWVTWVFWEATPTAMRTYVATPSLGSRHNRGCAVDVGLVDSPTGKVVAMPSGFDEFTDRAHADYAGGGAEARANRDRLIRVMQRHDFRVNRAEWWHYDHVDWPRYCIQNAPFAELAG